MYVSVCLHIHTSLHTGCGALWVAFHFYASTHNVCDCVCVRVCIEIILDDSYSNLIQIFQPNLIRFKLAETAPKTKHYP